MNFIEFSEVLNFHPKSIKLAFVFHCFVQSARMYFSVMKIQVLHILLSFLQDSVILCCFLIFNMNPQENAVKATSKPLRYVMVYHAF